MPVTPFAPVPHCGVEFYPAGQRATQMRPGDFILAHGHGLFSALIRVGQRVRVHGDDVRYTYYNHAAQIVSTDGLLIEAISQGVTATPIRHYDQRDYHLVRVKASDEDRRQMVAFATRCLGARYGWLTDLSIGLSHLTGNTFSFGVDGQLICSGLVAQTQERGWAVFSRDASHIAPQDLAKYYGVLPPTRQGRPPHASCRPLPLRPLPA